jgi:hypothetical protein
MLTKCANPNCTNEFHYLRKGRVYQVVVDAERGPLPFGPQLVAEPKRPQRIEHYWLCDECAATMTLAVDRQRGLVAVLTTPAAHRAAAS